MFWYSPCILRSSLLSCTRCTAATSPGYSSLYSADTSYTQLQRQAAQLRLLVLILAVTEWQLCKLVELLIQTPSCSPGPGKGSLKGFMHWTAGAPQWGSGPG